MKNIGAFLKLPGVLDYPLSETNWFTAYKELSQEVQALGGNFFIVRGQETYLGEGKFIRGWQFEEDQLVEKKDVQVDLIFDKGEFISDGNVRVFNESFVNEICTNKWLSYNLFKQHSPRSWFVRDKEGLRILDEVSTELAVIKPIAGQEGEGVKIAAKGDLFDQDYSFPVIVQEFLDSSHGIPGVIEGFHDLRVALIDGEVIYSYYRTPPQGSYLANVARGGRFEVIDLKKIPDEVLTIVKEVDQVMKYSSHRFYGIDFALTPKGPKIIELNSRLGLLPNGDHPVFVQVKKKLAAIFLAEDEKPLSKEHSGVQK